MNELDKAIGGVDVIDVLNGLVDNAKRKNQMKQVISVMDSAIENLNKAKNQKPSGYETSININGYEFNCIVDYDLIPAEAGEKGDYGQLVSPNQPAYIDMGQIWVFDGSWQIVDIPEKAMTDTLDEILEEHNV